MCAHCCHLVLFISGLCLHHQAFALHVADMVICLQERIRNAHCTLGKTALHMACEEVCLLLDIT